MPPLASTMKNSPRPPVGERRVDARGVQRRVVADLDRVRGVATLAMVGNPLSHDLEHVDSGDAHGDARLTDRRYADTLACLVVSPIHRGAT
jgi:hypothetical protein